MSEEQRFIFRYHDGEREIFADPLELERDIRLALGGDPNRVLAQIRQIYDPQAPPEAVLSGHMAAKSAMVAVRGCFKLKPIDRETGKGCGEATVWKVWRDFNRFLTQKKTSSG